MRLPPGNTRGPLYLEQALSAVHQSNPGHLPFTLILARTKGQVGLFIRCPVALAALLQAQLFSAFPDAGIDVVSEAALQVPRHWKRWTTTLTLNCPLFPIRRYNQFDDVFNQVSADTLTNLLTTFPTESDKEMGWFEWELRPASHADQQRAKHALERLTKTDWGDSSHRLRYARWAVSGSIVKRVMAMVLARCFDVTDPVAPSVMATSSSRSHEREADALAAADKIGRQLFHCQLRIVAAAPMAAMTRAHQRLQIMAGAFGVFNQPRLASFIPSSIREDRQAFFGSPKESSLLSTEEVATLWHPPTLSVQGANVSVLPCRQFELPATLPLAKDHRGLAILGDAIFRQQPRRFGLLPEDRFRHLYLAGKTGMGKSTLLWQLIVSDIRAGRGIAAIDPHGDLIESLLPAIPSGRSNQVILFDAGDRDYPIAFNPLACPDPTKRPLVASAVLSAFKKIFGDSWGPRLEHILRNSLLTLLELPEASLLTLLSLLGDAQFRRRVLARVSDPVVRTFWEREFASWPAKFQAEALAPVLNKLGHFVSSPLLRNIVGQARSRIDLRSVMDEGKILLVNLAKGRVGEDASALLGAFLVTGLQQAAMARADLPPNARRDFYLYCDEFQNYTTDSFAVVLAEARKYRMGITLAHQFLAQTDQSLRSAVFGNVGTMGVFQVGAEDAEILTQQLGGNLTQDDLLNVPKYHAYARLLIDGQPSRPFLFQTLEPDTRVQQHRADAIRRYSRQRYSRPAETVAAVIERTMVG